MYNFVDKQRLKPCPQGDCPLCLSGEREGLRHHPSGAVYRGDSQLCGAEEGKGGKAVPVATYWGESGDSG